MCSASDLNWLTRQALGFREGLLDLAAGLGPARVVELCTKYAARYRALSADHLEHLDEAGVAALREAGTVAVLLPGAFYFLRETKLPPLDLLRRYQVPVALATDANPGSAPIRTTIWSEAVARWPS